MLRYGGLEVGGSLRLWKIFADEDGALARPALHQVEMAGVKQATWRNARRSAKDSERKSRTLAVGTGDGCRVWSATDSESKRRIASDVGTGDGLGVGRSIIQSSCFVLAGSPFRALCHSYVS